MWVTLRRLIQAHIYGSTTQFYLQDIWNINLSNHGTHVVITVYGLYPIMKRLGMKLKNELSAGSIVISLFFEIPGWKRTPMSSIVNSSMDGTHTTHIIPSNIYIYIVPSCWEE